MIKAFIYVYTNRCGYEVPVAVLAFDRKEANRKAKRCFAADGITEYRFHAVVAV